MIPNLRNILFPEQGRNVGCIKNGVNVHMVNYGVTIRVDVYRVGNCFVLRANEKAIVNTQRNASMNIKADVAVVCDPRSEEFWRDDLGVFVVREENLEILDENG